MTRILITGCAGFIGYHLTHLLLTNPPPEFKTKTKTPPQIFGIDTINNYYSRDYQLQKEKNVKDLTKLGLKFYNMSILEPDIMDRFKPTIVVHLAAYAGVRYSIENPELYMRTNIEGTTNLLRQAAKYKSTIKNFVYASSSSVYGRNTKIPFTETDPLNNINSPYAASKRASELVAKLYSDLYDLTTIGLRFFTVYGPRGRHDMAPHKFLKAIVTDQPITRYGNGEDTYRDYTYVDDIVKGIVGAMLNRTERKCEVYNLGNNSPVYLNTFIKTCEEVANKSAIIEEHPKVLGDVDGTFANILKAKSDLGYEPTTSLKEGLTKFYEYEYEYKGNSVRQKT